MSEQVLIKSNGQWELLEKAKTSNDTAQHAVIPEAYQKQAKMSGETAQHHFIRDVTGYGGSKKDLKSNPVSGKRGRAFEVINPNTTRVHFDPQSTSASDFHSIAQKHGAKVIGQGKSEEHGSHWIDVEHPSDNK